MASSGKERAVGLIPTESGSIATTAVPAVNKDDVLLLKKGVVKV
jgi:hypothetical protein